jgi:hypothetical protein
MNRRTALLAVLGLAASVVACKKDKPDDAPPPPTVSLAGTPLASPGTKGALPATAKATFSPKANGFKFENYGNDEGYENLGPAELRRMFGDKVCADLEADGSCILAPAAKAWMEEQNKGMSGGHCEGFAALALLFHLGKANVKDFGGERAFDLDIAGNAKLQREIAYWFVTQNVPPMANAEIKTLTPVQVVEKLDLELKSGKESYTLGVYQPGYADGHATTAYGVVDKGDGVSWILHYDNNFPGEEKHVEVDRTKNTWKYFTAANPAEPGMEYRGDAETFTLTIAPTSVRTSPMQCPFCGDLEADKPASGSREIFLDGLGDLLVTDESGHHLGHANGKLVNDIPGASIANYRSRTRAATHEPVYSVPAGKKLTVTLDGTVVNKPENTDVVMVGPGYTMGVHGIKLDPNQKDTLEFSADWSEVSYATQGDETPVVSFGVETPGPDFLFLFKVTGEAGGQKLDLALDLKKGVIAMQAHGKAGKTAYALEMHRIDKGGDQVFAHEGLAVGSSEVILFNYGAWKGNGQPMAVGHDTNHDGTADKTENVSDDK